MRHLHTKEYLKWIGGMNLYAKWAINFYLKHGFRLLGEEEKNSLLFKYWSVPVR